MYIPKLAWFTCGDVTPYPHFTLFHHLEGLGGHACGIGTLERPHSFGYFHTSLCFVEGLLNLVPWALHHLHIFRGTLGSYMSFLNLLMYIHSHLWTLECYLYHTWHHFLAYLLECLILEDPSHTLLMTYGGYWLIKPHTCGWKGFPCLFYSFRSWIHSFYHMWEVYLHLWHTFSWHS